MHMKTLFRPALLLGGVLFLSGCVTPYVGGSIGTRVGSGGYIGGSIGGYYPGGGYRNGYYDGYGSPYGYDRYGNPIYRGANGRVIRGYDDYRRGYDYTPYPPGYYGYGYYPPGTGYYRNGPRHDYRGTSRQGERSGSPRSRATRAVEERRRRDDDDD